MPDDARPGDLLVFYGSLLRGLGLPGEPAREPGLTFVGPCRVAGELYVVGDGGYPALRLPARGAPADAVVLGEAWRVEDLETLRRFDDWELGGYSADADAVPYHRVLVRLLEPDADAWVYEGLHPEPGPRVPDGDWRARVTGRAGGARGGVVDDAGR